MVIRYYNCVPFAGCVFVTPSKMCQPRVKTFEELPLEVHAQTAPQVSPSNAANAANAASVATSERVHVRLCLPTGQPDGQRNDLGLRGIQEDWTPADGLRLQEVSHSETAARWDVKVSVLGQTTQQRPGSAFTPAAKLPQTCKGNKHQQRFMIHGYPPPKFWGRLIQQTVKPKQKVSNDSSSRVWKCSRDAWKCSELEQLVK